jgi:hypothetical protein
MGWKLSVHVAQSSFENVVCTTLKIPETSLLRHDGPRLVPATGGTIPAAYVDDYFAFGLDADRLNSERTRIHGALSARNLSPKDDKEIPATTDARVIGGELIDGRVFGPDRTFLCELTDTTRKILSAQYVSGEWLERVIGRWMWVLLSNRSSLSIVQRAYRYIRYFGKRPGVLWQSVRDELECLIALRPLLYQRLGRQFDTRVYCSDASLNGGGFTYTNTSDALAMDLALIGTGALEDSDAGRRCRAQLAAFSADFQHIWGSSHGWRFPDREIARLEFSELRAAVRHYARRPGSTSSRLTLLCDNTAVVGAVNKGRSSTHYVNANCRRLAAYLLGGGIRLHVSYIPTDLNPADAPSRLVRHHESPSRDC